MRFLALVLLLAVGCVSTPKSQDPATENVDTAEVANSTALRRLELPYSSLKAIKSSEQLDDYIARYWDKFDFAAGERIVEWDRDDLCAAFAQYVLIIPRSEADSLLRTLIRRTEQCREVVMLFADIAHDVLYDPNAPTRNDEYYISVLETLLESKHLDEYDRIIPQRELDIVRQNRLGELANDFTLTLASGTQLTLHSLRAEYTILLFNNPGCEMCRQIIDQIEASRIIGSLRKSHDIKVVALYPDEDLTAWRAYLSTMPDGWICAYDKDLTLTTERLYDLKAIPSLYLLDSDKRVIIKDGSSVEQLEKALYTLTQQH